MQSHVGDDGDLCLLAADSKSLKQDLLSLDLQQAQHQARQSDFWAQQVKCVAPSPCITTTLHPALLHLTLFFAMSAKHLYFAPECGHASTALMEMILSRTLQTPMTPSGWMSAPALQHMFAP